MFNRMMIVLTVAVASFCSGVGGMSSAKDDVAVLRVPDDGIQPQAQMDDGGVVHMIYFKGDPGQGDVFYVHSEDGVHFSEPIRVNSQPGSAIAAGTVRGPHLAIGKNNRVHAAWMGSGEAQPKAEGGDTPMLYARMNDAGDGFEEQRNVISKYVGLDGGGSIAVDNNGNVYIAWHAPREEKTEADRHIWVARSSDDGKTFEPEIVANTEPTGACACCGMRIFAGDDGTVYVLYRTATEMVNRDMHLLVSDDQAQTFAMSKIAPWKIGVCVMSTTSLAQGPDELLGVWETQEQVFVGRIDPASGNVKAITEMPGDGQNRKHPAVAVNSRGESVVAWTEETGWNKGGIVAWQKFDRVGRPMPDQSGRAEGLPVWGLPAVIVRPDDTFAVIY